MISYAQLCEALAGGTPAPVSLPAAPAAAPAAAAAYAAAQPLPPSPAAPDESENTVTNLNLASVDPNEAEAQYEDGEMEIGDAEIDSEE
jgi:hypothetical protein